MQTFNKTLGPSEKWVLEIPGVFFRLISTQYPVSIKFLGDGRARGEAYNVEGGYWVKTWPDNISRIEIENGAFSNSIKIAISVYDVGYDRVSGDVNISNIIGISKYAQAKEDYGVFNGWNTPVSAAGYYPALIVEHNGSYASGDEKDLLINSIKLQSSKSGYVFFNFSSLMGGTLLNEFLRKLANTSLPRFVTQLRLEHTTYAVAPTSVMKFPIIANTLIEIPLETPITLTDDTSLIITHGADNCDLYGYFDGVYFPRALL